MRKKVIADNVIKLLKKGYSPKEITERMAVSYNYAWKLKKDLEKAAGEAEEVMKKTLHNITQGRQKHREAEQNEAIARIKANRHEVPEHQQHLITEHEWDGYHDRVWCHHGIDQLGEMCEVCYPETVAKPEPTGVNAILDERGSNYGSFLGLSQVTQRLKTVAHNFAGQNNKTFDPDQAEALDMIFTKLGRILNGDPNHIDSWIDIAGYATLVADRLKGKVR
jgi:transposase